MGEILKRHLQRVMNVGPETTTKQILNNPKFLKLLAETYQLQGRVGVLNIIRQADASLSDDDVAQVSDSVISQVFTSRASGIPGAAPLRASAYGDWRSDKKRDIESMTAQISQPKGGTENFTNGASPGSQPGKISAVPGKGGSNYTGRYRTDQDQENNYKPGSYSPQT